MSSTDQGLAVDVGAWLFAGLSVVFFLLYTLASPRAYNVRSVAFSAVIVSAVTSAVNFAQLDGISLFIRSDGAVIYWLEWAGYSVSLFFIGFSLRRFLSPTATEGEAAVSGIALSVVGLGGLLGLFASRFEKTAQGAAYGLTSFVYVVWIVQSWRATEQPGKRWVLVYFVAATLFYLVGYFFGPPLLTCWSASTEKTLYLIGNVFTKALLPFIEMIFHNGAVQKPVYS